MVTVFTEFTLVEKKISYEKNFLFRRPFESTRRPLGEWYSNSKKILTLLLLETYGAWMFLEIIITQILDGATDTYQGYSTNKTDTIRTIW